MLYSIITQFIIIYLVLIIRKSLWVLINDNNFIFKSTYIKKTELPNSELTWMTAFRPRALSSKEVSILHQTPTIYFFFLIKKRFLLFSLFFLAFAIIIFPCFVPFSKDFSCFSGSRVMFFCLQVNARKKETKLKSIVLVWF